MQALDEFNEMKSSFTIFLLQYYSLYSMLFALCTGGGDKSRNALIYFKRIEISILYLHQRLCITNYFSFLWGTTMFHPILNGE